MTNIENLYAIILAGGSGTRLWPLSRELYPKHLLKLPNHDTLFKTTVKRLKKFVPASNLVFSTNTKLASDIRLQLTELDNYNYNLITEPDVKNTAPAIALSVLYIIKKLSANNSDPLILIIPSDHVINDEQKFEEAIQKGVRLAEKGHIVTFGVKPQKLDTGYGYIIAEESNVAKFKEKPDLEEAKKLIEQENCYWNCGIYLFRASIFLHELEKYSKETIDILKSCEFSDEMPTVPYQCYKDVPEISIDHAVMEHSQNIALIPLECGWQDVGSWEELHELVEKDSNNNFIQGDVIDLESENSFIYGTSKLISTIGLKNTVIIETEDAILACDKNRTEDVKQIFGLLKNRNDLTSQVHKTVYRPWGFFTVIQEGEGYKIKIIQVNPGAKLSLQMHHRRSEHWVILAGEALVTRYEEVHSLKPGESIDIPLQAKHMLHNPGKSELRIIEVQNGEYLEEDDIVRFEDIYGRVT
ncbi:MAG: mannose-1-phosphate guanylyltransferase/mannose-6-phosphate isomerase [Candidatus Melainabacteria bacterium GWF2_37_15]|nr:MAG: mannose-1-phosphate guanylyltransferase/mannose-6-phosphate isomerase [Candidatus Melainabacteria bacterium GWF2_37_15]